MVVNEDVRAGTKDDLSVAETYMLIPYFRYRGQQISRQRIYRRPIGYNSINRRYSNNGGYRSRYPIYYYNHKFPVLP